ncbi:hypothetical protein Q8F55_005871 [Vanrija albida]|uniref:rRNA-processing protein FYV7 n=1 Tax=Vanrija albida TaxID=181172 RepID=A0ABR3Q358_9TREE
MPRITRKQKEAGVQPRKKKASTGPNRGGAGGFKVGPKHAPKDAYLGRAQKLKASLIEAAKVKKQYAKVLAAEGMSSTRLKRDADAPAPAASTSKRSSETKGKSAAKTKRRDPFAAPQSDDDFSDSEDEDDDEGEDAVGGSGSDEDETPDDKRVRSCAGPAPGDTDERRRSRAGPAPGDDDRRRSRAGPAPESGPSRSSPGSELKRKVSHPYKLQPRGKGVPGREDKHEFKGKGKFDKGKGKPEPAPPAEPLPSLRTMKREAFSKHHNASSAPRAALGGAKRGQPNMGSRMDMLLEKIKRSKA